MYVAPGVAVDAPGVNLAHIWPQLQCSPLRHSAVQACATASTSAVRPALHVVRQTIALCLKLHSLQPAACQQIDVKQLQIYRSASSSILQSRQHYCTTHKVNFTAIIDMMTKKFGERQHKPTCMCPARRAWCSAAHRTWPSLSC